MPTKTTGLRFPYKKLLTHKILFANLAILFLLLPFITLSFYNQPYWDDYGNAVLTMQKGAWGAQAELYATWTGRYGSSFLLAVLNPLRFGWMHGLILVPLVLLLATGLASMLLLKVVSGPCLSWPRAGMWAGVLLLLYLCSMPSVYSAFYWFTSAMVYQAPAVLFLLFPATTLLFMRSPSASRYGWYAISLLCVIFISSSNEVSMFILLWSLALTCAVCYGRKSTRRYVVTWFVLFMAAGAAGVVSLLAPGNFMRRAYVGSFRRSYVTAVDKTAHDVAALVLDPAHLLLLVLLVFLFYKLGWKLRSRNPFRLYVPLPISAAAILIGLFLGYGLLALTVQVSPARCVNFLWFWLINAWLLALWFAIPVTKTQQNQRRFIYSLSPAVLGIVVILAGGRVKDAWRELSVNASSWKQQHEERYAAIAEAKRKGEKVVIVPPTSGIAPRFVSIIGEDISTVSSQHINLVTAKWFAIDSIKIQRYDLPRADSNYH